MGGPNCLGLMHAPSGMVALPTGFPEMASGPVGVVLQSGMMAPTVLVPLLARGMGISFAVTTGNEADVEAADYIRYLAEDEQTRVIGVFAEQIKTPGKFIAACTIAAEQQKPIVMLKIGHSEAARRAALAHTGSLVGSDDVIDAVLRKLGVSRVDSVDELLEQLAVFHSSHLPQGSGVATVIVSGGAAGLLSDLAPRCGVNFPPLPEATAAALREVVPEYGNVGNPLDVTGQAVFQTEILARSLDLLAEAPGIDVVVYGRGFPSRLDGASPVGKILSEAIDRHPETVFLAMSLVGGHFFPSQSPDVPLVEPITKLGETPFLQGSENGLKAIAALIRYADFLRTRGSVARPAMQRVAGATLLEQYGISSARSRVVASAADAVAAAEQIGYPVALKVDSPTLLHKTDAGAVLLNLGDVSAVARGFEQLTALDIPNTRGVLVQEMVHGGVEMILGMKRDPQFGPVLAVGLGGIFVELLEDVQLLIPPVTEVEVRAALERLRGYRVLLGARGQPALDVRALVEAVVRFGYLCLDTDADEIDVNPLIVLPHGIRAVDCLVVKDAAHGPARRQIRAGHWIWSRHRPRYRHRAGQRRRQRRGQRPGHQPLGRRHRAAAGRPGGRRDPDRRRQGGGQSLATWPTYDDATDDGRADHPRVRSHRHPGQRRGHPARPHDLQHDRSRVGRGDRRPSQGHVQLHARRLDPACANSRADGSSACLRSRRWARRASPTTPPPRRASWA